MELDLLTTVILQAPNVAVALFVVWWQGRHIDKLADAHRAQTGVMLDLIGRVIAAETALANAEHVDESGECE